MEVSISYFGRKSFILRSSSFVVFLPDRSALWQKADKYNMCFTVIILNKTPTRCTLVLKSLKTLFCFMLLDMFRTPMRPSSGASYCCTCSLWSPWGVGSLFPPALQSKAGGNFEDFHRVYNCITWKTDLRTSVLKFIGRSLLKVEKCNISHAVPSVCAQRRLR
jgi:hypothetical protein